MPIEVSRRLVAVFAAIWHSTTGADRIPHLAGKRPIRHISPSQRQARRRHNQSGEPLIDSLQTVQGNRATSYIDPRNFEEFYYGKGKGSRKDAHLSDTSDSKKARRIAGIRKAGLEPIIRVIARNLSEHDALLIEKTLLWKLGKATCERVFRALLG